jgi:hypothetical protein
MELTWNFDQITAPCQPGHMTPKSRIGKAKRDTRAFFVRKSGNVRFGSITAAPIIQPRGRCTPDNGHEGEASARQLRANS